MGVWKFFLKTIIFNINFEILFILLLLEEEEKWRRGLFGENNMSIYKKGESSKGMRHKTDKNEMVTHRGFNNDTKIQCCK